MAVAVAGAASLCAWNIAPAVATPGCIDHADHGTAGNSGDPGNGQEHHNESNGIGNIGDPGNAGGKFCPTDN
jgi:hypothetical protein